MHRSASALLVATLVIVAVAVAGLALAQPVVTPATYLPVIRGAEQTPTNTPLLTATNTLTPRPTNTPGPTLTPSEIPTFDIPPIASPCDQNQPTNFNPGVEAWMTVLSPSRFSQTTICARYMFPEGVVDRGAILHAVAHYKTTDTDLGTIVAGNDGVAHLTFNIGGATVGFPVTVDGTMRGVPFSTSFTPQ